MDGPGIDAIYEKCLLVLCFEGEEAEMMDLPTAKGFLLSIFSIREP